MGKVVNRQAALLGVCLVTTAPALAQFSIQGEHAVSRLSPEQGDSETQDLHKITLSFDHRWDDAWQFESAVSVEQGWAQTFQTDDPDPDTTNFIVEQALVSWRFAEHHQVYAGRFYLPIGTLNSTSGQHEEYGALRNPVEINIIPTNWVETGLGVKGKISDSWRYDAAIHSALVMPDAGLVRDGRDPDSFSISKAHAFTFRFQYQPWEQFLWSSSIHFEVDTTGWVGWGNNSAILFQNHLIYRSGPWRVKAFHAYWDIDGIRFEWSGREKQNGWYLESSYQMDDSWGLFVRVNEWDNEQDNRIDTRVRQYDIGANWRINSDWIVKADYNAASGGRDEDRINLGLTWRY